MAVFHEAAKRMNKIVFVIAAVFLCLATFFIANRNQPGDSWVAIMAWGKYGNHFALFFLNACLATFAILLIAYCLNNFSVLAGFGKNSLLIMAYHYILFPYTIKLSTMLFRGNIMIAGSLLFPIVNAVIVLLLALPMDALVNRFIPNLAGKNI